MDLPAVVAAVWWLRRGLSARPSPIAVYLPIVLLAAVSAGNGGSSVNYLIEPVLAVALAVPFAWRALPREAALVAPMLAHVQPALPVHWPHSFRTPYLGENARRHPPTHVELAIGAHLD